MPCIQLRAETTKAKRADVLPLRRDISEMLKKARGEAGDGDVVCRTLPSMDSHKRYLVKAGIDFEDADGRRADFHALRHTYGSMLAKVGVAPRVAMSLMRHTDMRLTMNVYTDPRIFDMAGAVEMLPAVGEEPQRMIATGTDGTDVHSARWRESVTSTSAPIGECLAPIGNQQRSDRLTLTLVHGSDRQQKTPSGRDGVLKRVKGVEPSTFTLAT